MNKVVWLALALLLPLLTPLARGEEPAGKKAREYDDPARLENEVRRFEEADSVGLPPAGAIVCTGSSSMKGWHATIREDLWKNMQAANALIKAECDKDKLLTYIDVAAGMLDASGQPRKDIYQKDNLHLVRKGYEIWRDAVRPALLAGEGKQESKAEAAKPAAPAPAP
jgi:hypothetical protein